MAKILVVEDNRDYQELLCNFLKNAGYEQVSLSVQKANYAAKMYRKLGFEIVIDKEEEYIMVKYL